MAISVSQVAIEEPDSSFPSLPKPSGKMLQDPEFRTWWNSMEKWWGDAILAIRNQSSKP